MMIEKIARALAGDDWDGLFEHDKDDWRDKARAALTAMLEYSPAMMDAGQQCEALGGDGGQIYRAMIQAAQGEGR